MKYQWEGDEHSWEKIRASGYWNFFGKREKTFFFIVTYKVEGNLGIRDTMKTKSKSTILLARLFVG